MPRRAVPGIPHLGALYTELALLDRYSSRTCNASCWSLNVWRFPLWERVWLHAQFGANELTASWPIPNRTRHRRLDALPVSNTAHTMQTQLTLSYQYERTRVDQVDAGPVSATPLLRRLCS